jgi:hypothetical protein
VGHQHSSLDASTVIIDLQDQKFLTSAQHRGKESGEQMEFQNATYSHGGELQSKFSDPPSYLGWKTKEQGKITQTQSMLGVATHSAKHLQNIEFSDQISAQDTISELHQKEG